VTGFPGPCCFVQEERHPDVRHLESPPDTKALSDQLSAMMPSLFEAADAIGTIHYSPANALTLY
jgi:hypothetical protein